MTGITSAEPIITDSDMADSIKSSHKVGLVVPVVSEGKLAVTSPLQAY